MGEEYIYTVYPKDGIPQIKVQDGAVTYFGLPGTEQENMRVIYDGPATEFDGDKVDAVAASLPEPPNDFLNKQTT